MIEGGDGTPNSIKSLAYVLDFDFGWLSWLNGLYLYHIALIKANSVFFLLQCNLGEAYRFIKSI